MYNKRNSRKSLKRPSIKVLHTLINEKKQVTNAKSSIFLPY
jgi:hypothetical protein